MAKRTYLPVLINRTALMRNLIKDTPLKYQVPLVCELQANMRSEINQ